MTAEEQVQKTIKTHNMIAPGSRIVLGLSGGPDSLCLLHILLELQRPLNFRLRALHVNHCIRGEEADADEAFLRAHCEAFGIPLRVCRADVPALAQELHTGTEDAGRLARAKALKDDAAGDLIALAHNREDQAETVLLRILRGTGVHGLCAMDYVRQDGVIRPLLDTPRAQIEDYCSRKGLSPRIDSSNLQPAYARNRVRLELLPLLRQQNPRMDEALVRLASSAREDDSCLRAMAERFLQRDASEQDGALILPLRKLRDLDAAVRKRVFLLGFARLGQTADISAVHLESLSAAVGSGKGGLLVQMPGGYFARTGGGKLSLHAPEKQGK